MLSLSIFELQKCLFIGRHCPWNNIDGIFHGFSFDIQHPLEKVLILLVDFGGDVLIKGELHLEYLLFLLESENVGLQGVSILVPGFIFLRLFMCFW